MKMFQVIPALTCDTHSILISTELQIQNFGILKIFISYINNDFELASGRKIQIYNYVII